MTTSIVRAISSSTPFTMTLTDDLAHAWPVDERPRAKGAHAGPSPGRLPQIANTCLLHQRLTGEVRITIRRERDAAGSSTDATNLAWHHT